MDTLKKKYKFKSKVYPKIDKIVGAINELQNFNNRDIYEYSESEIGWLFGDIQYALDVVQKSFYEKLQNENVKDDKLSN